MRSSKLTSAKLMAIYVLVLLSKVIRVTGKMNEIKRMHGRQNANHFIIPILKRFRFQFKLVKFIALIFGIIRVL